MTESAVLELVADLNDLLRRMPRVAGNFLALEVPCAIEEVTEAYAENKDIWFGSSEYVRLPEFSQFGRGHAAMSLTSLLTAACPANLRLSTKYVDGRLQVEAVRNGKAVLADK